MKILNSISKINTQIIPEDLKPYHKGFWGRAKIESINFGGQGQPLSMIVKANRAGVFNVQKDPSILILIKQGYEFYFLLKLLGKGNHEAVDEQLEDIVLVRCNPNAKIQYLLMDFVRTFVPVEEAVNVNDYFDNVSTIDILFTILGVAYGNKLIDIPNLKIQELFSFIYDQTKKNYENPPLNILKQYDLCCPDKIEYAEYEKNKAVYYRKERARAFEMELLDLLEFVDSGLFLSEKPLKLLTQQQVPQLKEEEKVALKPDELFEGKLQEKLERSFEELYAENEKLQKMIEMLKSYIDPSVKRAIDVIGNAWKDYIVRKNQKREDAVTLIQATWRMKQAQKQLVSLKSQAEIKIKSVLKVLMENNNFEEMGVIAQLMRKGKLAEALQLCRNVEKQFSIGTSSIMTNKI